MFKYILFDLDGTLTDPGTGITNSIMYALEKMSAEPMSREELYKFIGPPLLDSFSKYCGMNESESKQALEYYREYFVPKGMYENEVYPGIPELLSGLKNAGKHVILATSKPEPFSVEILRHFGLDKYFDFIAGSTLDEKRTKKSEVISYIIDSMNISDICECIMIGDREHDILGAKQNGMRSIGVTFGYGSRKELESAGADYIADTPSDIFDILK